MDWAHLCILNDMLLPINDKYTRTHRYSLTPIQNVAGPLKGKKSCPFQHWHSYILNFHADIRLKTVTVNRSGEKYWNLYFHGNRIMKFHCIFLLIFFLFSLSVRCCFSVSLGSVVSRWWGGESKAWAGKSRRGGEGGRWKLPAGALTLLLPCHEYIYMRIYYYLYKLSWCIYRCRWKHSVDGRWIYAAISSHQLQFVATENRNHIMIAMICILILSCC